jgi:hypothetical protein
MRTTGGIKVEWAASEVPFIVPTGVVRKSLQVVSGIQPFSNHLSPNPDLHLSAHPALQVCISLNFTADVASATP